MATRVNVTSVEAIEDFRTSLIIYLSKAKPALEEVAAEVGRTRVWVQYTQRSHWDGIFKRNARELEEAKAALFSAKMSNLREVSTAEQMMVVKCKQRMEAADIKLRVLKKWDRDFDTQTEPISRQLEKLHSMLHEDLINAVAYLTQTIATLQAYADMVAPTLDGPPPETKPPGESGSGSEGGLA
jgi:hypothetical protein